MVQGVRSSATAVVFDLQSEAGVVAALAAVRGSQLSRDEKSELRDLIFAYTKSDGDTSLEANIQNTLRTLTPAVDTAVSSSTGGASSVPTAATVAKPPRYGFSSPRPEPTFSVPPVKPKNAPVATPTPAPVKELAPIPTNLPVAATEPEPDLNVTILKPVPVRVVPVAVASTDMVPKAVVDEKLATVAPTPEATVELRPPYQEDSSLDTYRNRITEIKQFINQKVGNPVNLVDLDNTVGRAYMTALLEAMKAVSGGGGDVASLMQHLESVVEEVEGVILTKLGDHSAEPAPITTTPAAPTIPVSVPPVPVPAKSVPVEAVPRPPVISPVVPVRPVDEVVTQIKPIDITSTRFKNVIPVTAQEPLKTPNDLPTAAEMKARSGITDPLADPDVDLGLEQLLGEWSLFRRSGVFGTGPRASQHPLYQKLSTLPMPLILSGRFEGSTAEIRQSITDYMNGWRYEQGIIYEQDETFEHYLRRVIRHIIDSQTRRRTA